MALYYDLPVFKDVYKLTLLIYSLTKHFSKEYKYTLGQDLKKDVMVLMRSIYRANKAQNKKEYLEAFLDDFELLKLEVRLYADMKIITIKKHNQVIEVRRKPNREDQNALLSSMNSYLGIMKHYKTYNLRKRMLNKYLNGYWWNHVYLSGGVSKFILKTKPVKHSW